jgi:hypothetical protein
MTHFRIGQTVYAHGTDVFDFSDDRHDRAVTDVQSLARDLEEFDAETFFLVQESCIERTIKILVELDDVQIEGKVRPGLSWFVADADALKYITDTDQLFDLSDGGVGQLKGRGWFTLYGAESHVGEDTSGLAAYKRADGKLVRLTDREEIAQAKKGFRKGNFHTGPVLQDLEARA